MKATSEWEMRREIVGVYGELFRLGLNFASAGNVSVRYADGMLITPTGCTADGLNRPTSWPPASTGRARADCARRASGPCTPRSIVGCRPPRRSSIATPTTAWRSPASDGRCPPSTTWCTASGGDDVPCVGYFPFGTRELGAAAGAALETRTACLLANHGMLARGDTLAAALDATIRLEALARQYLIALAAGEPVLLGPAEMAVVAERYADYGRQQRPLPRRRWQGR